MFGNVLFPYHAERIGPLADPPEAFYTNDSGAIVPWPRIDVGTEYDLSFKRPTTELLRSPLVRSRPHPRHRYLDVPPPGRLRYDIVPLAERIFEGARTTAGKVARLENWFVRNRFRYDDHVVWTAGDDRLRRFLDETRTGDCVYFATATALLLRCAGVSTRIVVGYNSWEWDGASRSYAIRNESAHSWLEVWARPYGWLPVDPVTWVPRRLGAGPEEEDLGTAEAGPARLPSAVVILGLGAVALVLLVNALRRPRRARRPRPGAPAAEETPLADAGELPEIPVPHGSDPAGRVLHAYQDLQRGLQPARRHRLPEQTPREHGRHVSRGDAVLVEDFGVVNDAVYRVVYGEGEVESGEAERVEKSCLRIRRQLS